MANTDTGVLILFEYYIKNCRIHEITGIFTT